MPLYGAIAAVIKRKVSAFVNDVRKIVNAAKAEEEKIVADAEAVIAGIRQQAAIETAKVHDELISAIERL